MCIVQILLFLIFIAGLQFGGEICVNCGSFFGFSATYYLLDNPKFREYRYHVIIISISLILGYLVI